MSETETTESQPTDSIQQIKEEMQSQYNALKSSFDQKFNDLTELNDKLTKENEELKRALINSTFTTPVPPVEKPKTDEEIYADKIDTLVEKTKIYMTQR